MLVLVYRELENVRACVETELKHCLNEFLGRQAEFLEVPGINYVDQGVQGIRRNGI